MAASDTPWSNFSQADYSPQQWQRACLIDTEEGKPDDKSRYKLPVREPSGTLNVNGVHAAAGRLGQVDGVSSEQRATAARKLVALYKEIGEDAPDNVTNLAGDDGERSAPALERLEISHFQGYKAGSLIEVRGSGAQSRSIGGYAAVFGKPSENLGGFYERVHPQAFNKSKADGWPNVICRWNHRDEFLLGTTRSGTLQLKVDNLGLDYQVDLPECRNDILEMTQRRDLAHSSFAFQTYDEEWAKGDGGYPIRMLMSCRLIDVAPVTSPAYPDATVGLRSFARFVGAPYEDVVDRAKKDELRSFWQRTDNSGRPAPKKAPKFGPQALMEILSKRPEDPIATNDGS